MISVAALIAGLVLGMRLAFLKSSPRVERKQQRLQLEATKAAALRAAALERRQRRKAAGVTGDLEAGRGQDDGEDAYEDGGDEDLSENITARSTGVVCECGAIIGVGKCTPEEIERHKASNRHARNMLRHSAKEVVACEEVSEYRAAAVALVKSTDLVLEVGSHVGGTTKFLASVAGTVVGLDQQPELVAQARQKFPEIQFENFDAFDAHKLIALAKSFQPRRFTKVFIDISGSRDLGTVVRLVDVIDKTIGPELTVVKSQALKKMLLRSKNWIQHPAFLSATA